MKQHEMYENENRTVFFKKNQMLEHALNDMNNLIEPLAKTKLSLPQKPIVLILGNARSGSTLMLQYLSSLNIFSYPSNLIARFYKNPYLGIRIQQSLLEFDASNQLEFENNSEKFKSNLGKTSGALAPSEYWYFWREYFKFGEINKLNPEELLKVDSEGFLKKLSALENLTGQPLVMKGMMVNWNIPYLYSIYPKFIFVNLKRDKISNAQSLLKARKIFFNDAEKWYSFKPEEYKELSKKSVVDQVVGQVYYTQEAIDEGLETIPKTNIIDISYEEFCENPSELVNSIKLKFNDLNDDILVPILDKIKFKKSLISEQSIKFEEALNDLRKF
jgi:hypothetical protein